MKVVPCVAVVSALGFVAAFPAGAGAASVDREYGHLPLAFAPNHGQSSTGARFVAAGPGYAVAAGRTGVRIRLPRGTRRAALLAVGFPGAARNPAVVGAARLPGRVNYLLGKDPSGWLRGLPTYARVRYRGLWPGVDAAFYGRSGRLEYDFDVAPRADPSRIALAFDGARRLRIAADGSLRITVAGGEVRQLAPHAYQRIGGRRVAVASSYRLTGSRVRIRLGPHDRSRPLVIDPALAYATYLGGAGTDLLGGVAADAAGDAYVSGSTTSTDFPHTTGASAGAQDAVVAKLNPAGTALVYSTFIGGTGSDSTGSIAVDGAGDAYIAGTTTSRDFPVTDQAFQVANHDFFNPPDGDLFVTKLSPDGSSLVYSTYLGGSGKELGGALALGGGGSVYVAGVSQSPDYPTTPGALRPASPYVSKPVLTRLSADGSGVVSSTYGGGLAESVTGIALDPGANAYITGQSSGGLTTTPGAYQTTYAGDNDGYVQKLNPTGTALVYSTYLGTGATDYATGVAVDASGHAYVTGTTHNAAYYAFPTTPGVLRPTGDGDEDQFVAKFNPDGSALDYSTLLGSVGPASSGKVAVDGAGHAYVTGAGTALPTTAGAAQAAPAGSSDGLLAELAPDGSNLAYATFLGGTQYDRSSGLAFGPAGSLFLTGFTGSPDFPVTAGAVQGHFAGSAVTHGWVAQLTPGGPGLRHTAVSGTCTPDPVLVGASADCTVTVTDDAGGAPLTPTGGVSLDDSFSCASLTPVAPGTASCHISVAADDAAASPLRLPILYAGAPGLRPAQATLTLHETGGPRSTKTQIGPCSPPSVVYGAQVTCPVTVTDTAGGTATTPHGPVDVTTNGPGSASGCFGLTQQSVGVGTCTIYYSPAAVGSGTHTLTATFGGDAQHAVSPPATTNETATAPTPVAPTFTLTCTPASAPVGQRSFCSAVVDGTGFDRPTGTVSWSSDGAATYAASCTLVATARDAEGQCGITYRPTAQGSGTHHVTASYGGDARYLPGTRGADVTVTPSAPRATTTATACSPTPRAAGAKVSCKVIVHDSDTGSKQDSTGTVSFTSDGAGTFGGGGSCALSPVNASPPYDVCYIDYTPAAGGSAGIQTITATYGGDPAHAPSSATFAQTVTGGGGGAPPATGLLSQPANTAAANAAMMNRRTPIMGAYFMR